MRLNRATVLRGLRALLMVCLAWELVCTVKYPQHNEEAAEGMWAPAWHRNSHSTSPVYSSTALLRRCQAAMSYNTSSGVFQTGELALWRSTEPMFSAHTAAAWASWQEIIMTAKNPWAMYWAYKIVPESWHIMPTFMRDNLGFFRAAVPVLLPDEADPPHAAAVARAVVAAGPNATATVLEEAEEDHFVYRSGWVAKCSSPVNQTTLRPVDVAYCTVLERYNTSRVGGHFQLQLGRDDAQAVPAASGLFALFQRSGSSRDKLSVIAVGPAAQQLHRLVGWLKQYRPLAVALKLLSRVWYYCVPTGSLDALVPLLTRLSVLELEWEWEVMVVHTILWLVVLRNWLYLVTVAYKVTRRIRLLALHGPLDRFNGTLLTFVGCFLGLWQSMGYALLDAAVDALLVKLQVYLLGQSPFAALWVFYLSFEWGVFEMRAMFRVYKLGKLVWADMRTLVMNPALVVLQQGQALTKPRQPPVATIGPWPSPLHIPDEVDELPMSEVPRGFICPITQAIMRQPALLLHDGTITPSTYDKEAISQWLAEHTSDPKVPGTPLVMKSVKLVYNGDLARAIEDWVAATLAAKRDTQQVLLQHQRLRELGAAWQHLARQQQQQQQQQQHQGLFQFGGQHQGQQGQQSQGQGPVQQQWQQGQAGPSSFQAAATAPAAAAATAADHTAAAGTSSAQAGTLGVNRSFGMSDAGQLVRQSSQALAQVATLDIPAVAAASLVSLADTTRRMTTRAAARRLQQQQQQQQGEGVAGSSSGNPGSAGTVEAAAAGPDDGDGGSIARRSPRVKYRARRKTQQQQQQQQE